MTDHPCKGMTPAQVRFFERIAAGENPGSGPATVRALENRGLIVCGPDETLGHDILGPIRVPTYSVPIAIHAQWSEWCAEQPCDICKLTQVESCDENDCPYKGIL